MSTIGGSLEQLASLARQFEQQAQAAQQLKSIIRSELKNAHWEGPAAERFRSMWAGEFEPALARLEAALQESGAEVARRRSALEAAGS